MSNQTKDTLKVDVVDTQPCSVTLNVEVASSEVTGETQRVYDDIRKSARIPGFRPGKAPMDLVKKNFAGTARERVVENLIKRNIFPGLQAQGITPVDFPVIEDVSFDFDKPLVFKMRAEKHPEFTVKDYTGIKIRREVRPVTDEKVRENIDSLRERNASLVESKSETVTDADFALIDYEGLLDDTPVPELKTAGQMVDMSAPQMLAGFKEGLLGAKKGEERDVKATFPADYPNKNLAGKEVLFKVRVNEIKTKQLPELDDEFAKDFGVASLAELETKVRESMEAEEKKRQDQEVEKQVIDHLLAKNEFPVPDSLVREQLKSIMDRMAHYFRHQGLPESAWKKNEEQWREKYREEAERNVRTSYILNEIAREQKLEVTDEDLSAELERLKTANPGRDADVEKYFNENRDRIASSMKEEKIFDYLIGQAKVKEEVAKEK